MGENVTVQNNGTPPEGPDVPVVDDFKFKDYEGFISWGPYENNGRLSVQMMAPVDGMIQPIVKISVNLPEEEPGVGCFFVRDWLENEGIFDALIEQGVVEDTGRRLPVGNVEAKEARLLMK
jgi:hypothetical protein